MGNITPQTQHQWEISHHEIIKNKSKNYLTTTHNIAYNCIHALAITPCTNRKDLKNVHSINDISDK